MREGLLCTASVDVICDPVPASPTYPTPPTLHRALSAKVSQLKRTMDGDKEITSGDKGSVVDAPPPEMVKHIDDKILKHSHDADAALKAFEGYEGQVLEISEETNKRLLRKIDRHLMPVSTCPYTCIDSR